MGTGLVDNALAAAGTSATEVGMDALNGAGVVYEGLQTLGEGAVLVGLVLGTIVTFILEKKFLLRRDGAGVGAVLSFIGLIHAPEVELGRQQRGGARLPDVRRRLRGVVAPPRGRHARGGRRVGRGDATDGAAPSAARVPWLDLAVAGAHLEGLPLHHELVERGARLRSRTTTSRRYRLYALAGGPPARAGLVRVAATAVTRSRSRSTASLARRSVTCWSRVPPPLAIGTVELASGEQVHGFVCEASGSTAPTTSATTGAGGPSLARLALKPGTNPGAHPLVLAWPS